MIHARPEGAPEGASGFRLGARDILDARVLVSRGRRVNVSVTGPDGAPLAGVTVLSFATAGQVNARTDASGVASLSVPSGQAVQIVAMRPENLPDDVVLEPQILMLAADATEAAFSFRRGKRLRLLVLDPDDVPIPGVQVEMDIAAEWPVYGQADDDGRIEQIVTAESVDVRVRGTRVVTGEDRSARVEPVAVGGQWRGLRPGGEEVTLRCVAVATDRTLSVRVLDPEGLPIEGAQVGVTMTSITSLTDVEGMALLENLRAEPLSVWAFAPPHKDGRVLVRPAPVEVTEPSGQTIEVRFRRAARVTGVVFDAAGKLIRGASVTARLGDVVLGTCVSETGGVFDLDVPADTAPFRLTATWATTGGASVTTVLDDVRPNADVRLQAEYGAR
jgi:hypothetical protein